MRGRLPTTPFRGDLSLRATCPVCRLHDHVTPTPKHSGVTQDLYWSAAILRKADFPNTLRVFSASAGLPYKLSRRPLVAAVSSFRLERRTSASWQL